MSFPKYMMATKATHILGDLSRDKEDICRIEGEEGSFYVGSWVTGFGFFNVMYPKSTTRDLTEEETEHFDGRKYRIGSQPAVPLRVKRS